MVPNSKKVLSNPFYLSGDLAFSQAERLLQHPKRSSPSDLCCEGRFFCLRRCSPCNTMKQIRTSPKHHETQMPKPPHLCNAPLHPCNTSPKDHKKRITARRFDRDRHLSRTIFLGMRSTSERLWQKIRKRFVVKRNLTCRAI